MGVCSEMQDKEPKYGLMEGLTSKVFCYLIVLTNVLGSAYLSTYRNWSI